MVTIRLGLADKAEIFREGLAKLLQSQPDIEVVFSCGRGLEAVENTYQHHPDIILIDKGLTECTSVEAVQRILERLPKTKIIALTHSTDLLDVIYAFRIGVKAWLSKDDSIESIVKSIALVADGGVVVSSPMGEKILAELNSLEESKDEKKSIAILSRRELEVLSLVSQGFHNRDIASTLGISENTVKVHLRNIMEKLGVHTRQEAVRLVK